MRPKKKRTLPLGFIKNLKEMQHSTVGRSERRGNERRKRS